MTSLSLRSTQSTPPAKKRLEAVIAKCTPSLRWERLTTTIPPKAKDQVPDLSMSSLASKITFGFPCPDSSIHVSVQALLYPTPAPKTRKLLSISRPRTSQIRRTCFEPSSSKDVPKLSIPRSSRVSHADLRRKRIMRRGLSSPTIISVTPEDHVPISPVSISSAFIWLNDHVEELDLSLEGESLQVDALNVYNKRDSSILPPSDLPTPRSTVLLLSPAVKKGYRPLPIPQLPPILDSSPTRRRVRPLPIPPLC